MAYPVLTNNVKKKSFSNAYFWTTGSCPNKYLQSRRKKCKTWGIKHFEWSTMTRKPPWIKRTFTLNIFSADFWAMIESSIACYCQMFSCTLYLFLDFEVYNESKFLQKLMGYYVNVAIISYNGSKAFVANMAGKSSPNCPLCWQNLRPLTNNSGL